MKVLKDEAPERKITIELTEKELTIIVASLGEINWEDIKLNLPIRSYNKNNPHNTITKGEDYTLYTNLDDVLENK